jgi:hypothetical protein
MDYQPRAESNPACLVCTGLFGLFPRSSWCNGRWT